MHRTQCLLVLLLLVAVPLPAAAQQRDAGTPRRAPRAQPPAAPDAGVEETTEEATEPAEDVDASEESTTEEDLEEPRLRPPTLEPMIEAPLDEGAGEEGAGTEGAAADDEVDPADAAARLEAGMPPTSDPTEALGWTAPQSVFTLHGYFRVRGEMQDTFFLGREPEPGATNQLDEPFGRFRPYENGMTPSGGCGDEPESDADEADECDTEALGFANMRLRLQPTLSLSEDVRVHMTLDVFDNMVLGSTPSSLTYAGASPDAPSEFDSQGQNPPTAGRNSLSDSIVARRAWAEVTNRSLGQLRFGRMGWNWGLGMYANSGDDFEADYETDVDRIMGITKLAGLYFIAAYDFASEGLIQQQANDIAGLTWDAAQDDDVDQYMFAIARRMDDEDQEAAIARGDVVLNGGLFFLYRDQFLSTEGTTGTTPTAADTILVRRNAEAFVPDAWVQLKWRGLRVELETALVAGSIENSSNEGYTGDKLDILEFGGALETEYRLLDDKLGLYFNAGYATGDPDVDGLTLRGDQTQFQDDTISTFRFHPNYRIDLILWRNIMRQVAGAYYLKPGISYDFIRSPFGQLLGGRVDIIWSRASQPVQTWGSDADLGIEINAALYYRSEDGPELLDGFYGSVQYGVLFPMKGLGYPTFDGQPLFPGGNPDLDTAQTLRLLLGVQF